MTTEPPTASPDLSPPNPAPSPAAASSPLACGLAAVASSCCRHRLWLWARRHRLFPPPPCPLLTLAATLVAHENTLIFYLSLPYSSAIDVCWPRSAAWASDAARRGAVVCEAGRLARESNQDRRCLASAGAARALATAIADSSVSSVLLDDVLAARVLVMPLDEEAIGSSTASVALLANVAKHGDLQSRLRAAVNVREIVVLSSCCSRNGGATTAIDLSDHHRH
uniref:Uncharacterized protein n=1 Tax=Oryza nivara TaxID=4536 RepID=A0A0E0HTE0_ORYNI